MVKSKQLKILRKKLDKANRTSFDLPPGAWSTTSTTTPSTNDDEKENVTVYNNNNDNLTLQSWSSDVLKGNKQLTEEVMQLFEANMGDYYRQSSWGLDMDEKRAELLHPKARFLVLTNDNNDNKEPKVAGFCHYRFDYDDDDEPTKVVLYVYELQIQETQRRQGLGQRLMAIVENMLLLPTMEEDISTVMLTVFKANQGAMDFYLDKMHYQIDDNSPSKCGEVADYEILSKNVK